MRTATHFAFLLTLLSMHCKAQTYIVNRIGIEHGLSSNFVVSITQDKQGFLWFATEFGLNRFDGNTFRVYKKSGPFGQCIKGNELNKVLSDKTDDLIWVASQREGFYSFDIKNEVFTCYTPDTNDSKSITANDITDIKYNSEGNLWISFYHEGIDFYNKKTKTFTNYNKEVIPELVSDQVWTIADDGNDNLYIGHVNSGLSILSLKNGKVKNFVNQPSDPNSLPGNEIRSIFIDKNENVWIGTNNGLAIFNANTETFIVFKNSHLNPHSLSSNTIMCINQLDDNRLWIGTENGGINILDIRNAFFHSSENLIFQKISCKDDESGLSNSTIRSIYQDSYNNIWIGTFGGGINFISSKPQFFNKWSYSHIPGIKNSLTNKVAWGICIDDKDRLWIGTDGGGINIFDNGENILTYTKEKGVISDNAVLSAFKDSDNNLWFGTFKGGVNRFNSRKQQFSQLILPDNEATDIRCFFEDNDKNIWIGSNKGLFIYNLRTTKIKSFTTENSGLPDNMVRSISQDSIGLMWIGTFGEGLCVFDPSEPNKVQRYYKSNGFCSNMINYIFRDSKNRMFIATGEGLVLFESSNETAYKVFQEKNGISGSLIFAIMEGQKDEVWFSTNEGISRFFVNTEKIENYNLHDGIPLGIFMSGSVAKSKDGVIYFGSQNGVCYFNSSLSLPRVKALPAEITSFKLYSKRSDYKDNETFIPVSSQINLNYYQNTFSIGFNVLDFALNNKVEFAYRLKGIDDTWQNTMKKKEVTFRNISPGNYQFELKSRIKNLEWSNEITALKIIINPPVWFTWWAKTIYLLSILYIIFHLARFYKKDIDLKNSLILQKKKHQQTQELNNERIRFFTNMTHELRTPLTLIIGPLEDILADSSLQLNISNKIAIIHQSASRLLNLINQILDFRKTETQNKQLSVIRANIADLVNEIGSTYKELNQNEDITINVNIEKDDHVLLFDPEFITAILNNLISNAIKYTLKGEINIYLRTWYENNISYTEIEVKDTGIGISHEDCTKIFDRYYQVDTNHHFSGSGIGLALVKNLVKLHQGDIYVDSVLGKGSSFRVRLLTNNIYPNAIHKGNVVSEIKNENINTEFADIKNNIHIILVIEDDLDIQKYIKESFSGSFEVLTANDGKSGLDLALLRIPDVIISDIMMPVMDGIELCRILKGDVRTSHIPIILLTAKVTIQDKTEGYFVGADSYITKPFSANLLHSRIHNLLESRRKLAELISSYTAQKRATFFESLNKLDNEFIEKITTIVNNNLDSDKIDVAFIADQMCMSHSTLYRKLKALVGISANEFIRKIKLQNAEQLLLTGKYNISEVAFMVGINSLAYFRQCFKDQFGASPSEYLKKVNKISTQ